MRAICVQEFGGPQVLQLVQLPDPRLSGTSPGTLPGTLPSPPSPPSPPGTGQLLIRIQAAGVNPVDTYIRSGTYAKKPSLPYTPGTDGAGIVAGLDPGITGIELGQRVYLTGSLTGTYAELALCERTQVHPLPDHISFAQGAALGVPYVTAHYALFNRAGARPGEIVLVHGATGGVGLAAVQIARAAGMTVFATGGSETGRQLAREAGAHEVFDHSAPDYLAQITATTAGHGLDVILEMLANVNLAHDLTLLSNSGRVAVIGSRGPIQINPRELMVRNSDVRGVILSGATPADVARIHAALRTGLADNTLRPVIGREFPLSEAAQAHEAVMASGAQGKIVLVP